jgi:hypothetical protein
MASFVPPARDVPTTVSGYRAPNDSVTSTRLKPDVQQEIAWYFPSAAPFTALSTKVRKRRTVSQYQFYWLEKDIYPRIMSPANAYPTGAETSVDVAAGQGARLAANALLMNRRTREQILVTAVSTDTLTVVRGIGDGGTGQPILATDDLELQAFIYEDGSDVGTSKTVIESAEYNLTEIIRTPFAFTGRQINTDLYGGKDPAIEQKWAGIEHTKSIENRCFFGKRHSRTGAGGKLQTFCGGLEYYIKTNVWDLNGQTPTERSFVEYLEYAMQLGRGGTNEGSGTKYLFGSRRWMTEIEFWAKDRIEYRPMDKTGGLKLGRYETTHGTIMLVTNPLFDGEHGGFAFLVDMNHVRLVNHQGRATKLLKNRQGNGIDGKIHEYLSDISCQVELEAAHGILKGLPE